MKPELHNILLILITYNNKLIKKIMKSININKRNLFLNKLFKIFKMKKIMHKKKLKDLHHKLINSFKAKIKKILTIKPNLSHLMINFKLRSKKLMT